MKVELDYWLRQGKGVMGENFYISPLKYEPGWGVVRRKPGPRNPRGRRKKWIMPESQAAGVEQFNNYISAAKAIYADPAQRAQYDAAYKKWLRNEKRQCRTGGKLAGRTVRHLWDYVRVRMAMNNPL